MNPVDLDFVKRYVALWNEPKAARRRQTIEELWTADGANYTPSIQAVGYDAIDVGDLFLRKVHRTRNAPLPRPSTSGITSRGGDGDLGDGDTPR